MLVGSIKNASLFQKLTLNLIGFRVCDLCTSQFQDRPSPPGRPPGIWPTLSSVQWGIWPKSRPTRWGIWLSCQNVCQRSETKRISQFFDTAREPHSQVIALVDSTWVFLLLSFYIVISWNMPLFKAWSEDKLNKKFVVAENFVCIKGRALLTL